MHVINFFCFAGLALGAMSLALPLNGKRAPIGFLVLLNFGLLSIEYMVARVGWNDAASEVTGMRGASLALAALHPAAARAALHEGDLRFPADARVALEMRTVIGDEPVSSLSVVYNGGQLDGLNLKLYPVIQRYSAYTPYLDRLNAAFLRDSGPRFLLFDGRTIDRRHPWAETPAMWLEVYRWYNTRLLGAHNLLLERRSAPRFGPLKTVGRFEMPIDRQLDFPASGRAMFWTLDCRANIKGKLQQMLLGVPEVTMRLGSDERPFRIIPQVMVSPMPAQSLPSTLGEFASVLSEDSPVTSRVATVRFGGPGMGSYGPACQVEFLTP